MCLLLCVTYEYIDCDLIASHFRSQVEYVADKDGTAVYLSAHQRNRLRIIPVADDFEALWILRREQDGECGKAMNEENRPTQVNQMKFDDLSVLSLFIRYQRTPPFGLRGQRCGVERAPGASVRIPPACLCSHEGGRGTEDRRTRAGLANRYLLQRHFLHAIGWRDEGE